MFTPSSATTLFSGGLAPTTSYLEERNAFLNNISGIITNTSSIDNDLNGKKGATIVSPLLLSLAGIAGHITALFYLHIKPRQKQNKTVFYLLLTTLIWTDLIGKLITTPQALVAYVTGVNITGNLCKLHGFFMITIALVTHFLVATMALDRFLCVRHCMWYKATVTRHRIRVVLISIWGFCITYCSMPLFDVGEYKQQYPGTWCFLNLHVNATTGWTSWLYTNVFGTINICHILIILICNMIVIGTLISKRISRDRKLSASSRSHSLSKTISMSNQAELEIQMSIVLLVITIVFVVSWSPLDFRLFLNQIWAHQNDQDHTADLLAVRLASFNQIIDPWAYIICRKFYHQIFTSKIWKNCRSVIIGRHLSSRRQRLSANYNPDGSSNNIGLLSIKRKFSLPTPDKGHIISNYCEEDEMSSRRTTSPTQRSETVYVNNETKPRLKIATYLSFFKIKSTAMKQETCRDQLMPTALIEEVKTKKKIQRVPTLILNDTSSLLLSPMTQTKRDFRINRDPESLKEFVYVGNNSHMSIHSTQSYYTYSPLALEDSATESECDQKITVRIRGRRHSWSGSPSIYKHFESKSTQTLEDL